MSKEAPAHLLNRKNMALSLGISVQAFDKWNVEPVDKMGREKFFSVKDVLTNRIQNHEAKRQPSGEELDLQKERARLTHHQANMAFLDERVKEGELIPAEVVEQVWCNVIANFRSKVLAIPTKSAHALINIDDITEIQDILKSQIYEALEELAEYDPKQYGIKTVREVDQDDSTAA